MQLLVVSKHCSISYLMLKNIYYSFKAVEINIVSHFEIIYRLILLLTEQDNGHSGVEAVGYENPAAYKIIS